MTLRTSRNELDWLNKRALEVARKMATTPGEVKEVQAADRERCARVELRALSGDARHVPTRLAALK